MDVEQEDEETIQEEKETMQEAEEEEMEQEEEQGEKEKQDMKCNCITVQMRFLTSRVEVTSSRFPFSWTEV